MIMVYQIYVDPKSRVPPICPPPNAELPPDPASHLM
tara:strand:+ start:1913 stop:2020 length:108 start_codon:yes stop_codon:yes gene_type:complete